MISLTRLNGERIVLNADLIERAEATPDTVLTLTNGTKYVVAESLDEVLEATQRSRATVLALAAHLQPPTGSDPPPRLRVVPAPSDDPPPSGDPPPPCPPEPAGCDLASPSAPGVAPVGRAGTGPATPESRAVDGHTVLGARRGPADAAGQEHAGQAVQRPAPSSAVAPMRPASSQGACSTPIVPTRRASAHLPWGSSR